jgi:hypothetical protein
MLPGPTQVRGIATGATSRNGTRPEDRREVHAHRAGRLARVDGDQSEGLSQETLISRPGPATANARPSANSRWVRRWIQPRTHELGDACAGVFCR